MKKFNLVATGGTFDRFHKGHAALLKKAFMVSEQVIIGVTSDLMVKKLNKQLGELILPYEERVADLKKFLKDNGFFGREIIEILEDIAGPTVLNGDVEAIVCTKETKDGALEINLLRKKKGKSGIAIIECSFIKSADNYHISSTRIRLGEINRQGEIILEKIVGHHQLPKALRNLLSKPIDKYYPDIQAVINKNGKPVMLISVGDRVSADLIGLRTVPDIIVFDNEIQRKTNEFLKDYDIEVTNKAGTVTDELVIAFKRAVAVKLTRNQKTRIKVNGEEDLAVIPAILTAPLGSLVIYGQPPYDGKPGGVVGVEVNERMKKWIMELLDKFM